LDLLGELLVRLRSSRKLTRGQVARRLKISTTVLYNMETGRSRIKLDVFFRIVELCGIDSRATLRRHMFSVQDLPDLDCARLMQVYRQRLGQSQRELAVALGYRTGSIYHHFEKSIRLPDLYDFIQLMVLAGDNVRGFVRDLSGDDKLAEAFPAGTEATPLGWHEYWEFFYIPAIRNIMRTATYRALPRYEPGYFSDILGITYNEERHALKILAQLQLLRWEKAKPLIDEEQRIIVPRDIPKDKIDRLKLQWLDFSKTHYAANPPEKALMTLDLLPVSATMYAEIRAKIRRIQDEIHNMQQEETDGIAYVGWLANYITTDR
jgi:transcriptional regulator with XRE-family HTH domain